MAIGHELRGLGGEVCTGMLVTGIDQRNGAVTAVHTSRGAIATRTVINAAGAWLPEIARIAGVRVPPLLPLQASRFVTEPLAEVPLNMPLLMFTDYHGLYLREEQGGLLIGSEEIVAHPPSLMRALGRELGFTPGDRGSVPADMRQLPDTTHGYHLWLARQLAAVPVLGRCVVKQVRNGMPTRTPDMRHLLGQASDVGGFYFLGGDCEIGVTHGPGLGRGLAELLTQGRTSLNLSVYQPDRW
jgi:glycine/D-amino acid oxidase-like deaminating enzyme